MVVQVSSTIDMGPKWRLLWRDTSILAVGFCIAGISIGNVKKRVAMWFINEWK